jgi:hypothetical protein
LTEVDFKKVDFVTCLAKGEKWITCGEKLRRLKTGKQIRYGATVFMGLWLDYQALKENSVLEKLYRRKKVKSIRFFGDQLIYQDGSRGLLYLHRCRDGWFWRDYWFEHGVCKADDLTPVSREVL